jgi:hypothetical protein
VHLLALSPRASHHRRGGHVEYLAKHVQLTQPAAAAAAAYNFMNQAARTRVQQSYRHV